MHLTKIKRGTTYGTYVSRVSETCHHDLSKICRSGTARYGENVKGTYTVYSTVQIGPKYEQNYPSQKNEKNTKLEIAHFS